MGNKALSTLELYSASSNPTTPTLAAGSIYYYSTLKTLRVYDGGAWVEIINNTNPQTIGGIKTFSQEIVTAAATTSIPSIRIPHGTAPSAPTNGDMWTTTAGLYVRINGSTVGPLSSGGGTPATTVTTLDGLQAAVVGTATNYAREDHKHAVTNLVDLSSTQSIGGQKTFTGATYFASVNVTDADYASYFDPNTIGIFANTGTYAGYQFQTTTSTTLAQVITRPPDATVGSTTKESQLLLGSKRWTGAASQSEEIAIRAARNSATDNDYKLSIQMEGVEALAVSQAGVLTPTSYLSAPAATTSIPSIRLPHGTAPSSPTNGDIWTTTSGMYARINGSTVNLMDLTSTQTISGAKTFQPTSAGYYALTIDQYSNTGNLFRARLSNGRNVMSVNATTDAGTMTLGDGVAATLTPVSVGVYGEAGGITLYGQNATSGDTLTDSGELTFRSAYWNGSASTVGGSVTFDLRQASAASGDAFLFASGTWNEFRIANAAIRADGLTGATTSTRWAGGTASAAPASGTFSTGDFVIATNGKIFICTTGGSPGTWAEVGSGGSSPLTTKGDLYTYTTTNARLAVGGTNGMALVVDSSAASGLAWVQNAIPLVLSAYGSLSVATGVSRVGVEGNYTIAGIRARVNTAPTGASLIVDVNKNGTTIFSTQANRPTITATNFDSGYVTNMNTTTMAAGDYFTIDVDQVGSTVEGSHLTVTIWIVRTS